MSTRRIIIKWTTAAKEGLRRLPLKVRIGLLAKADELKNCEDLRIPNKPLIGMLSGYYRITYSRYRAVYSVEEEALASGDVLVKFTVLFVAVGIRKERDKNDIYRIAQKMVEMGVITPQEYEDEDEEDSSSDEKP